MPHTFITTALLTPAPPLSEEMSETSLATDGPAPASDVPPAKRRTVTFGAVHTSAASEAEHNAAQLLASEGFKRRAGIQGLSRDPEALAKHSAAIALRHPARPGA